MINIDLEEFKELSKKGNIIPVYQELMADMETPLGIYSRFAEENFSFLLESVASGVNVGQYSFIGSNPRMIFKSFGKEVTIEKLDKSETFVVADSPVEEFRRQMQKYKSVKVPGLPRFGGGAVGYFSYDIIQFFEEIPQENEDELGMPELYFLLTKSLIAFDHARHRILVIANAYCDGSPLEEVYNNAIETISNIVEKLSKPLPFVPAVPIDNKSLAAVDNKQPPSNYTREEYGAIVEKCKEYIKSGDIIQVVPSQRFSYETKVAPISLYRALRCINPSPYMFLLNFGDSALVGTSPEIMVTAVNDDVEVRPIAGTRRRGISEEEDTDLETELLADKKELAEHTMLVDLGRNDIGRVCKFDSVEVPELMIVEKYSHVMHIVSDVSGKLLPGKDAFDALAATFPAGTVSGAPKIRAMEIIEEVEKCKRGPYAGAVSYLGYDGNLDSCITIRTVIMKDGKAFIQAGGGIVADSIPELEYKETVNKARAMIKAIHLAGELEENSKKQN